MTNGPDAGARALPALSAAGLRVTRQRIAVLESIDAGEHLEVDAIADRARTRLGSVSTQAVYDVLRVLDSAGLVRRIEPAGKPALYEVRVGDNHHHLLCRSCGLVLDVDCAVGAAPCLDPADSRGFTLDEAEVIYWGTCPACSTNPADSHPDSTTTETHQEATA